MSLGKRVDLPSWRHPETTGKEKLGVGKKVYGTHPIGLFPSSIRFFLLGSLLFVALTTISGVRGKSGIE